MKNAARGFTLVEMIIVVTLVTIVVIPLLFSARQSTQLQNLRTSASVLSDDLQTSRVFSRDAREKKGWGIVSTDRKSYIIATGNDANFASIMTRQLERGVTFDEDVSVWFELGTGTPLSEETITLKNEQGQSYEIHINSVGVIETKQL